MFVCWRVLCNQLVQLVWYRWDVPWKKCPRGRIWLVSTLLYGIRCINKNWYRKHCTAKVAANIVIKKLRKMIRQKRATSLALRVIGDEPYRGIISAVDWYDGESIWGIRDLWVCCKNAPPLFTVEQPVEYTPLHRETGFFSIDATTVTNIMFLSGLKP